MKQNPNLRANPTCPRHEGPRDWRREKSTGRHGGDWTSSHRVQVLNRMMNARANAGLISLDDLLDWQDRWKDRVRPVAPDSAMTDPADIDTSADLVAVETPRTARVPDDPVAALSAAPAAPPAAVPVAA
jgi:hypothetical protein